MADEVKSEKTWRWLAAALFLFVFAKFWEPGVGISTATYGILARDILENGNWFRPVLGPGLYEPFVEHPYLALWMDAIFFKLFGVSAQTVRLTASVMGIVGFVSLFGGIKNLIDEKTALWSCLLLMTINVYMNYHSSGWLDMPMVGFSLLGFYFLSKGRSLSVRDGIFAGIFLAGAFLTKGVAALAIGPIFLFGLYRSENKLRDFVVLSFSFIVPIGFFTLGHYLSEGFFFWTAYFQRQFVAQNSVESQLSSWSECLWYLGDALKHGHVLALLCIPGVVLLARRGFKALSFFIAAVFVVHFFAYAFSSRHYTQYLLPLFPWMAVASAFFMTSLWKMKFTALFAAKVVFGIALVFFVLVDIVPITVHSSSGQEFKAFQDELYENTDIKRIYFEGDLKDQDSWEGPASYIRWYWNKTPVMIEPGRVGEVMASLKSDEGLVLVPAAGRSTANVCYHNKNLELFLEASVCDQYRARERAFSDKIRYWP